MKLSHLIYDLEAVLEANGDLDVIHSTDDEMNHISLAVADTLITETDKRYLCFFPGEEVDLYEEEQ